MKQECSKNLVYRFLYLFIGFYRFVGTVKDTFDDFKSAFKKKDDNIKREPIASQKAFAKIDENEFQTEAVLWRFWIELLESLVKKKFAVDDIVNELRENETLTRELNATMIQSALEKNANLSKELVSAKLEQAISENPNYTQEQKDFYLSKLADKDFMDKFYDTLGIKEIANKAKSNDELLALVNESFNGNFAKAKEKISESQIEPNTMNSLDDTALKSMSRDEVINASVENLKESKDLADTAGKVRKQD